MSTLKIFVEPKRTFPELIRVFVSFRSIFEQACDAMTRLQDDNAQLKQRLAFYESFSGPSGPFPSKETVDLGLQQR